MRPCHFFMVLGLSSLAKSRCSVPRVPVYLGRFSNIKVMALSLSHIIRWFELVLINLFYTYSLVTFLPVLFFNLTVCHHFCKLIDRKQLKFVFPFSYTGSYLWLYIYDSVNIYSLKIRTFSNPCNLMYECFIYIIAFTYHF